jgi:hypothetical protein
MALAHTLNHTREETTFEERSDRRSAVKSGSPLAEATLMTRSNEKRAGKNPEVRGQMDYQNVPEDGQIPYIIFNFNLDNVFFFKMKSPEGQRARMAIQRS